MRFPRLAAFFPLAVGLAVLTARAPAHEPAAAGLVKIGMLATMFRDVKPAVFLALSRPFHSLVESQTGLKSELVLVPSPDELRQQLDSGKLQFGVFHGFEFAWMKQKTPGLQALMIAAPQHRPLRAFLVVNVDSPAKGLADLKGKTLAVPTGTREYSRLFLARECQSRGQLPEAFFAQVTAPPTPDDALHAVVDGTTVQAAVVDGSTLAGYAQRYSGRSKRLRVLEESESFPESVVAYEPGKVDGDTVRRFQHGMSSAHATPLGRQLLSLWAMAGFQPIPADYAQQLAEIAKAYPPPASSPK